MLLFCIACSIFMLLYAILVMGSKSAIFQGQLAAGSKILGLRFSYSSADAIYLLQQLNEEGLSAYYKLTCIWDSIFVVIYSTMYMAWLKYLYDNVTSPKVLYKRLYLFPVLPALFDWIQNYYESRIIANFILQHTVDALYIGIGSTITSIKWCLSIANYLIIVLGIILILKQRIYRNKQQL